MKFECEFVSCDVSCSKSCFDCLFFKKCKFCVHASECSIKDTDKSCQFNPVINELLRQEKTLELIDDEPF